MTNPATMTTNELPTPRTEEFLRKSILTPSFTTELADFARQLERETLTLSADCAAMREALEKVRAGLCYPDEYREVADAALSTTAGTELLAEIDSLKADVECEKQRIAQLQESMEPLRDYAEKHLGWLGQVGEKTFAQFIMARLERAEKERDEAKAKLDGYFSIYEMLWKAFPSSGLGSTLKVAVKFAIKEHEEIIAQRDAAIERVKVLEAELAKKSD